MLKFDNLKKSSFSKNFTQKRSEGGPEKPRVEKAGSKSTLGSYKEASILLDSSNLNIIINNLTFDHFLSRLFFKL